MNFPDLEQFIQGVFEHQPFTLTPFESGGTNRHFCVEADTKYFLKVFQTNELQVVSRNQQYAVQSQVAKFDLAPTPLALSSCNRFWLEQWLDGGVQQRQVDDSDVSILANALSAIHRLPVTAQTLNIEAEWYRYLHLAESETMPFQNEINELLERYGSSNDHCFCHNDLHVSHIVKGEQLTILDWEYAAIGNRYFDLAACIQVNQLNAMQVEALLTEYAQHTGLAKSSVTQRTSAMIPVVDFTAQLWHNAYTKVQNTL